MTKKEYSFEQIKKVREKDIQDFLLEKLNPDVVLEFMNLIYDYYTHFEQQLLAEQAKNAELNGELVNKNQQLFKEQAKNKKLVEGIEKAKEQSLDVPTVEGSAIYHTLQQALNEVNK